MLLGGRERGQYGCLFGVGVTGVGVEREWWCVTQCKGCRFGLGEGCGGEGKQTYRSGDFWVSMTAATGIPKLETGPQKSVQS